VGRRGDGRVLRGAPAAEPGAPVGAAVLHRVDAVPPTDDVRPVDAARTALAGRAPEPRRAVAPRERRALVDGRVVGARAFRARSRGNAAREDEGEEDAGDGTVDHVGLVLVERPRATPIYFAGPLDRGLRSMELEVSASRSRRGSRL